MNLATLLRRAAADHADRVALRLDSTEIDYRGFADRVARFAGYLRATGVGEGDRVAVLAPNCLEYLVAIAGAWQAGAVGVPLNYMFPDAPLRHALLDSGARLVVLPAQDVERVERVLGAETPVFLTTGAEGSFATAVAGAEPLDGVVPRLDGDDALLMYTSGSTGVPKGVRQTHRNIAAQVDGAIEVYELTGEDHVLNCMPMFHVGGLQLASLPMLVRGGQITFMPR